MYESVFVSVRMCVRVCVCEYVCVSVHVELVLFSVTHTGVAPVLLPEHEALNTQTMGSSNLS